MILDYARKTGGRSRVRQTAHSRSEKLCATVALLLLATFTASCAGFSISGNSSKASIAVSITIDPVTATIDSGGVQQFAATVNNASSTTVTWTANVGTISASGLFTAPTVTSTEQATITATSTADSTKVATASVTINPAGTALPVSIAISPTSTTVASGGTQAFTATVANTTDTAVTWSASVGTISSSGGLTGLNSGLFTAPTVTSTIQATVTVTSVADTSKQASATVTINPVNSPPPVAITISPTSAAIASGGTEQFTATVSNTSNHAVTWSASLGTVSSSGLFTAPTVSSTTQATVTATSVADTSKQASATVTINPVNSPPPVTITVSPTSAAIASGGTEQFTATVSNTSNHAVTWSASLGTVSSSGLFTAPTVSSTTQATVTATSVADTSKHASATVTINAPPAITITISPLSPTVGSGSAIQFTATVSNTNNHAVTWSASLGTVSSSGLFTAPTVTSTTQATVTATSVADTSKHASANVTINPPSALPPTIVTAAVPNATIGQPYSTDLVATSGQTPYQWSLVSGALPAGIQLSGATGTIAGTSTVTGSFSFTAQVTDAQQQSSTADFILLVNSPNQPDTIPSTYFGMHISENIGHWPKGYIGSLGKGSGVYWPFIERSKGVYEWSRLDEWVNGAEANGVPFYYSNDYVPEWAADDSSTCSSTDLGATVCTSGVSNIQDWDNFMTALVTRYKGKIQMYELWNEPDQYFTGTTAQIVTMTNHMYNIVRSIDPQALIASPSANDSQWLSSFWSGGGARTVDVATTHGYPADTNVVPEVICAFRTLPLKALLSQYGISAPIWDTEGSWGETSALSNPDLEAGFTARFFILHWACGVQRAYWYAWDGGVPAWGQLWANFEGMNEAGIAYESVNNWLNGATMPNSCLVNGAPIPAPPALYSGVYTCDLTRPNGYQAQAVWDMDGTSTYTAPDQFTQYRDLSGQTYPIPSNHEVTIGYQPLLLEN